MNYRHAQDKFAEIRNRLHAIMHRKDADKWLAAPHHELGGKSPARAIHSGAAHEVEPLVAALEKK